MEKSKAVKNDLSFKILVFVVCALSLRVSESHDAAPMIKRQNLWDKINIGIHSALLRLLGILQHVSLVF